MNAKDPQTQKEENPPSRPKKKSIGAWLDRISDKLYRRKVENYHDDVIFNEKITPEPEPAPKALYRGSIDVWFLLWCGLLICLGAVISYSASSVFAQNRYGESTYFLWRYLIFAVGSIAITIPFVVYATPWFWKCFGAAAYVGSILLLLLVLVIGQDGGGAQRWIAVGPITIQPSEVAKLAVVMVLALYFSKYEKEITSTHKFGGSFKHGVLVPAMLIGLICGLVALEKHISGLMIIGMLGIAVMFMGGTRIRWIFAILGAIALAGVLLILVSSYAQVRVNTWLHLDQVDPRGSAWQTIQGLYAIGSGGVFGLGLGNSRQKYGYVSQPQNDFVFTIICEELGFIGAFAVILLFFLLIWRGFKIASKAPDKFSALVVYGLTFKVALQVAMNIAVVTNSMPNTGVALPFFSSGGTFLAIQIFEMGIILSISRFSTEKK